MKKLTLLALLIFTGSLCTRAQTAEVKLSFNEQFFDALLEAVFTHLKEPSVPLSSMLERADDGGTEIGYAREAAQGPDIDRYFPGLSFIPATYAAADRAVCDESVKLKKEVDGVRTAVRFRQGKIYAPIAFTGNYNPPLIGCIEFQGWAESNIELSFDKQKNALIGNARVLNVNLSGSGGLGSSLIARMVQSSIDRKVNPIEIISLDKLSFTFPVQRSGILKMSARGIRHQVGDRALDVFVTYEFGKG